MATQPNVILDYTTPQGTPARSIARKVIVAGLCVLSVAVIAAVVVPKFAGVDYPHAMVNAAAEDLVILNGQLGSFYADNGRYPTTAEGLNALVAKPSASLTEWNVPYVEKLPSDPWGHRYIYRTPGSNGKKYDLFSAGPDGQPGTADDVQ